MSDKNTYKLYYFNARGRGEMARLAFAAAKIPYEDIRFADRADWLKQKEELDPPFGQAPLLVINGDTKIAQANSIMKYISRVGGLSPSDNVDIAKCDMIVDAEGDFLTKRIKYYYEKDEEKKNELKKELDTKHTPEFLAFMERLLKANGKGYFVTDKLTYADISIFNVADNLPAEALEKFPGVKAHHKLVSDDPGIKAWLEKRPKTTM